MTLEAMLASVHLVAILALVTFMSSQAALCRIEWMNAAVVERLVLLDAIYQATAVAVLASLQPAWRASRMDPITALRHV